MGKWFFKLVLLFTLIISISACSSSEQIEQLNKQLEEKDAKIKDLENQLNLFEADCAQEVTKVTDELKEKSKQYDECYSGLMEVQKQVSKDVALPVIGEKEYEGWMLHNTGAFTIMLPPDVKKLQTSGIDSIVHRFESGDIQVMSDYGAYTGPIEFNEGETDTEIREEVINHNDAQIGMYTIDGKTKAKAYFPETESHNRLTVIVTYKESQDTATKILRSVKFN